MKHTEMIMVIEAHSEGKAIECKGKLTSAWVINKTPTFDFGMSDYRVKPEPKYKVSFMAATFGGNLGGDKYVEIKALEDALRIIYAMDRNPEAKGEEYPDFAPLKELIK